MPEERDLIDARHLGDALVLERRGQAVDGGAEGGRVSQERRDVLEDDPLLGEVRHVADEALEAGGVGSGLHFRPFPWAGRAALPSINVRA